MLTKQQQKQNEKLMDHIKEYFNLFRSFLLHCHIKYLLIKYFLNQFLHPFQA